MTVAANANPKANLRFGEVICNPTVPGRGHLAKINHSLRMPRRGTGSREFAHFKLIEFAASMSFVLRHDDYLRQLALHCIGTTSLLHIWVNGTSRAGFLLVLGLWASEGNRDTPFGASVSILGRFDAHCFWNRIVGCLLAWRLKRRKEFGISSTSYSDVMPAFMYILSFDGCQCWFYCI